MSEFIYLDHNATTPIDPLVAQAMAPHLTGTWANPSSAHLEGRRAKQTLELARAQVASCLGAAADEIVFTSGGTEANNLALRGTIMARGGGHAVTTEVEHPAVMRVLKALQVEGLLSLTIVGADDSGLVAPQQIEAALEPDTVLVSVMLANNEVGTIQPVREIADLCRSRDITMHTDAAQALGKIPVSVAELGADLLSVAGHKLYAPKGVGALYVRRGAQLRPVQFGAGHERGLRPGTESVLLASGLGRACELVEQERGVATRLARLRDRLYSRLLTGWPELIRNGHPERCLPNTLSVAFPGLSSHELLEHLSDSLGASAGSACHADVVEPSRVLTAMGVAPEIALATLRLSVGRFTTEDEIDEGARRILDGAAYFRSKT